RRHRPPLRPSRPGSSWSAVGVRHRSVSTRPRSDQWPPTRLWRIVVTRYRYYTATTLDGFLADDSASLDWLFKQHIYEDGPGNTTAFLSDVGVQIMGSTTYLWVLEHERAWLPEIPTVVFT